MCLGAGPVIRKGDTELSVRQIAQVVSLVAALEGPVSEGMPVQECEQLLQAMSPGELKTNLFHLRSHELHPYAPPSRKLPKLSPNTLPRASRRLLLV